MAPSRTWATPPLFMVDLDAPAECRWEHIVKKYLPSLRELVRYLKATEEEEYGSCFGPALRWIVSWMGQFYLDTEFRKEIEGIASHTASIGLTYDKLVVLNVGYDLLARCTSAVVACPSTGEPVHLRNMDWESESLWPLTIDVDFTRQGVTVFKGTTWVGFVGMYTGMRLCGWSVSLNYRQVQGPWCVVKNLAASVCRAWPASLLIRRTLQDVEGFATALELFKTKRLMAPCYLTLAGAAVGQGAVLERGRRGLDGCQALDPLWARGHPRLELQEGVCIATNIDCCHKTFDFREGSADTRWAEGDALLLTALDRRETALALIAECVGRAKAAGNPFTVADGFDVLGAAPVCNDQTVYTVVLHPASNVCSSRVVLQWEEYSVDINKDAWDRFQASEACKATKWMRMVGDRVGSWPNQQSG